MQDDISVSKIIHHPTTPFFYVDHRLARPFTIRIFGQCASNCAENIGINLVSRPDKHFPVLDIAFHLSVRPASGEMVRNNYWSHKAAWSKHEERDLACGDSPIKPGDRFDLTLRNDSRTVTGIVNGDTLAFQYAHRGDASKIYMLVIQGSIVLESVRFEFVE